MYCKNLRVLEVQLFIKFNRDKEFAPHDKKNIYINS